MNDGVRDLGLTSNLIYRPTHDDSFHFPKSHDHWGSRWALLSLSLPYSEGWMHTNISEDGLRDNYMNE